MQGLPVCTITILMVAELLSKNVFNVTQFSDDTTIIIFNKSMTPLQVTLNVLNIYKIEKNKRNCGTNGPTFKGFKKGY